jgi:RiboL-PSP-HEPN
MQRAFNQFKNSLKYVKELDALYIYLKDTLQLPNDLTDLLRAEWVYTISAMDKLIHELVRIGMIEAFLGVRVKTKKFLTFGISVDTYTNISSSISTNVPPPEYWFEQEVIQKHKHLSFQDPDKISDGLSFIWDENQKWYKLSQNLGMTESDLKTKLKTIIARRNQIVHEADLDLLSGYRNTIDKTDINDVVPFIETLSEAIFNEVK